MSIEVVMEVNSINDRDLQPDRVITDNLIIMGKGVNIMQKFDCIFQRLKGGS